MRSPGTNRSKQFSRDFIPADSRTLRRWRRNFASTPPKISELLCNKQIIKGWIEQSLVLLRTDSSPGELNAIQAAFGRIYFNIARRSGRSTLSIVVAHARKCHVPKTKAKPVAAKIYAVVGSDDLEVKHTAAELAEKLKPADAGDFGFEIVDGAADNADQAAARIRSTIDALRTLPFFGGEKLIWLKNANFLGDDQKARSTAVQAALEELTATMTAGLGTEITFLLSATEVDKRRSFYKALAKRAELQVFEKLDSSRGGWEEEATEMVKTRAKK